MLARSAWTITDTDFAVGCIDRGAPGFLLDLACRCHILGMTDVSTRKLPRLLVDEPTVPEHQQDLTGVVEHQRHYAAVDNRMCRFLPTIAHRGLSTAGRSVRRWVPELCKTCASSQPRPTRCGARQLAAPGGDLVT